MRLWVSIFLNCLTLRPFIICIFSDVCQFSHSDEECKVWNYMKENNSKLLALFDSHLVTKFVTFLNPVI